MRPCKLHTLPQTPTVADLEIGYVIRGADLVACDLTRRLAVESLMDVIAVNAKARR